MGTIIKGPVGASDVEFKDSGTTKETFTRTDSNGRTLTLDKLDGGHMQFRSLAKTIDDLVDGGYDVPIKPSKIFGGATNTNGHTVPNAADDTFVLRDTDETISGDKTMSGANTHTGANSFSGVNSHTGTVKLNKGTDVASEATLFDAAGFPTDGNYFDVTGVTGITTITTSGKNGMVIKLHFDGILIITNSADIVCPGGQNITTFAGLEIELTEYSSADWRITNMSNSQYITPVIMAPDHWPSFHAYLSGAQANITAIDQIEFDSVVFDTNSDFDLVNFRFLPTIAGKYLLTVTIDWNSTVAADDLINYFYKNGASHVLKKKVAEDTTQQQTLTVIVDANGTTDYFEVFGINGQRDTSSINATATQTYWTGCRIG